MRKDISQKVILCELCLPEEPISVDTMPGEKGEGSLNVTSLCAIRTLTWNIFGYPPMSSKLKHGGGGCGREKHVKWGAARFSAKFWLRPAQNAQRNSLPHTIVNDMRYYPFTWSPLPPRDFLHPTPTHVSCSWHALPKGIFSPYVYR